MDEKLYTLAEFRKNTREGFNLADDMVDVIIERFGTRYVLITESYYKELLKPETQIIKTSIDVKPAIKKIKPQEEFTGFITKSYSARKRK